MWDVNGDLNFDQYNTNNLKVIQTLITIPIIKQYNLKWIDPFNNPISY
ncbi:11116_t:CDS:1, partial [Cetraspora pellucida]